MEEDDAPSRHDGVAVDMTTLDITYITHRLLGESFPLLYFFPSMTVVCQAFKLEFLPALPLLQCVRPGRGLSRNEPARTRRHTHKSVWRDCWTICCTRCAVKR